MGSQQWGASSLCFSLSWNSGDKCDVSAGEEGVPSWLAAAWAFSVLNLCCRGLSSLPQKTDPVSALPHGFPCKARSHTESYSETPFSLLSL